MVTGNGDFCSPLNANWRPGHWHGGRYDAFCDRPNSDAQPFAKENIASTLQKWEALG
jgi:hypothetical protein